jgi:hypothetical protein
MDKVIYTCITDPKYPLKEFSYINKDYNYICFTTLRLKSKNWEIIKIQKEDDLDSAKLSRKYKILHHKYFPYAEKTIYIDSKFSINFDMEQFIKDNNFEDENIVNLTHPKRSCIYEEAKYCIENKIGNKKDIEKQIKIYRENNYPEQNGLKANGLLIRKNNKIVNNVMDDWWEEVRNFSSRDQISFMYILWKHNIDTKTIDFKYACNKLGL